MKTLILILHAFMLAGLSLNVALAGPISSPKGKGTGDGGGGNTCRGRPIESYAFNIKNTAAFKKYIGPIYNEKKVDLEDDVYRLLNYVMDSKTWFLLPCALEKLPDSKIGSAVKTEQAAIQTFSEVWNDRRLVRMMSVADQAKLYWHEIFMGIKLLRFESPYNQCKAFAPDLGLCEGSSKVRVGKPSDLTQDDYADVRKAATDILKMPRPISHAVWENFLAKRNFSFSRRFSRIENKMYVTKDQLVKNLETAELLGRIPKIGHLMIEEDPGMQVDKCKVRFRPVDKESLEVTVARDNGEVMVIKGVIGESIVASGSESYGRNLNPVFVAADYDNLRKGDRALQAELLFDSPEELYAVRISETVCTEDTLSNSGKRLCTRGGTPEDTKYYVCSRGKIDIDDF